MNDSPPDPETRRARFEQAALPLLRRVYNVALRLARRPEDASDLAQETFLRAYRSFDGFRPGTNCKAWLVTILYSVFINKYWKEKRRGETVSVELLEEGRERPAATDWRELDADVLRRTNQPLLSAEVEDALRRLPESFRVAVLLVDVEEMSYEEAAAALQCPLGTLRSRLFRARKLLFASLRGYAHALGHVKVSDER